MSHFTTLYEFSNKTFFMILKHYFRAKTINKVNIFGTKIRM